MPGLHYEDFQINKVYEHSQARSVTQFDDIWYSCMTMNTQPLHINSHFSETKGLYKKPLFNSAYTLSIVIGQAVTDTTRGTLIALIGLDDMQFPQSVFEGDTLYSRTTVVSKELSKDHPEGGVVVLLHEGFNQKKELVASCKRKVLVRRRAA
jgi:acyl dehydratase